ncbi:MAG: DDE-type integrase/transposase/recombinase, partial [Candidatus Cloacimonas acidaminovorans]|nr:DDE-type integrase/transposase/recombinase [Candidatus Cloacimonas acidaminovorans]
RQGWLYLVVIMDWYSRYVISWELSNTMEVHFCLYVLENALLKGKPEIFNSDQGVQFTNRDFTEMLEKAGIRISMDGRGRVYDNIFIEHLWRTIKYEEVYLYDYESIKQAKEGLKTHFRFYNEERFHISLNRKTPAAVYFRGKI